MKLVYRITLLILLTVSLTSVINILLTQNQKQVLHNDSEKILAHTLVHSLRDALVQDVIDGNKLRVTNLLTSLSGHENPIEYLYVTDSQHNIFAHSFNQGFPRFLLEHPHDDQTEMGVYLYRKFRTEDALIYEYSEQLISGLDTHLHIGINQNTITEKLARHNRHILQVSISATLCAMLIAYLLLRQMTRPLTTLTQLVRQFGLGERVDFNSMKQSSPEINQLAHAFQTASMERQLALNALKQREQDLFITLNSIGDAVITTDNNGLVTRMNPIAENLTGWSLNQALGQSLKVVFPIFNAATQEPIDNPIDKVLRKGEIIHLSNHTTLIAKNGDQFQIADSAAPIRNADGHIQGVVLVFNDVTEKYHLRQQRDKQLERFRELSNMALTLSGDSQNIFNKISALIAKLIDVNVVCISEIHGDQLSYLSIYDNGQIYRIEGLNDMADTPCAQIMQEQSMHVYHQVTDLFPKATFLREHHAVSYCGFPALDSKGNIVAITCLLDEAYHEFSNEDRDLLYIFGQRIGQELEHIQIQNELNMKEQQLRYSQKMDALDKLSGGIAHDYNNMLGIITGYGELLHNQLDQQPILKKYVEEILHASQRGAKLTKKLLAFSKRKASDAEVVDINELLRDEQHMLEKTLTSRIQLTLDLADDLWPTNLDIGDLEDTIVNMCINAMHAMANGGQLIIKTWNETVNNEQAKILQIKPGDYVLLSIEDTGDGMEPDIVDKIFEPFFTTKGDQGTGLGMSQVYGFIKRTNGYIKVFSRPQQGSRFVLYFPRYYGASNTSAKPFMEVEQKKQRDCSETILLVDDEQSLLEMAAEILALRGYKVYQASSGRQALEILDHQTVDLLLTDIIMPEMDGYELAATVRKKYPDTKIILSSGYTDQRHRNLVEAELHDNLIQKPYNLEHLVKKVRELLDQ